MDLFDVLDTFYDLLWAVVPVIIGIGVVVFLWGLVRLIVSMMRGDEKGVTAGRQFMVWGIVTLFVMVSLWGLVAVLRQFTGIRPGGDPPEIPLLPELP